jgi:hypothetical protein
VCVCARDVCVPACACCVCLCKTKRKKNLLCPSSWFEVGPRFFAIARFFSLGITLIFPPAMAKPRRSARLLQARAGAEAVRTFRPPGAPAGVFPHQHWTHHVSERETERRQQLRRRRDARGAPASPPFPATLTTLFNRRLSTTRTSPSTSGRTPCPAPPSWPSASSPCRLPPPPGCPAPTARARGRTTRSARFACVLPPRTCCPP